MSQDAQRQVAATAVCLVLEQQLAKLGDLPSGITHDVRFTVEAWVDGERIYQPFTGGGLLRTARRSGKPRFEPRLNYKAI